MKQLMIQIYFFLYNLLAPRVAPRRELPLDPMAALAKSFDAVWVLTIPRNTERQRFMRQELVELPFEFVTGVDGQSLDKADPRFDFDKGEKRIGRPMKINEMACSLSHLEMYQRVLDLGLGSVLILEDDAVFDRLRVRWVKRILERLPADWELLYLGYRDGELRGAFIELAEWFGRPRSLLPVVSRTVHQGLRTAAAHDFTHAYAITREGARKLLERAYPVAQTADGHLEDVVIAGDIRAYATVPKLFLQQEDLGSSIHNREGTGRL